MLRCLSQQPPFTHRTVRDLHKHLFAVERCNYAPFDGICCAFWKPHSEAQARGFQSQLSKQEQARRHHIATLSRGSLKSFL